MATASLSATLRSNAGKGAARSLRREGQIPAVIYGQKRDTQSLSVSARELEKLLSHISADNTIVEIGTDDGKKSRALIREIQRHPFKRQILHVDFQEVVAGQQINVPVPVVLTGTPIGVRLNGGMVEQILREVNVMVDPSQIPSNIEVDITNLDVGQSLQVGDLSFGPEVTVVDEPTSAVVVIAALRASKEASAEEEGGNAEPEVIKAKKTEEE